MAHPGGRPTKYNDEMCDKVYDFINIREKNGRLPTMAGLANYIGVNRSTLYEWKENYPRFSDSLEEMINSQEDELIHKGLKKEYDSTITKLMLSHNHGYKDRKDVTSGEEKIQTVEVFKIPDNERG